MKGFLKLVLSTGVFLLVVGCEGKFDDERPRYTNSEEGAPGMEGIFLDKGRYILIPVDVFDEEDLDLSLEKFTKDHQNFSYLDFDDDSMAEGIESGTKVGVWCRIVMESAPAQAKCSKIEVMEE